MGELVKRPVEEVLAGMGILVELDENDLVSDVVVLMKVIPADVGGQASVVFANPDGMDWITQYGILQAAVHAAQVIAEDDSPYDD